MTTTFKRFLFTALFTGVFSQAQAVTLEGSTTKAPHDPKAKSCHLKLSPGPHKTEAFNTFREKYLKNNPIETITLLDGPDGQNEAGKESGYHHLKATVKSLAAQNPAALAETSLEISGKSPLTEELFKENKLYVDIIQHLISARVETARTKALEASAEPGVIQRVINTVTKRPMQEGNLEESEKNLQKISGPIPLPASPVTPVVRPLPPSGNFVYINGVSAQISQTNMSALDSLDSPTYYRGITFDSTVTGSSALSHLKYLEDSTFNASSAGKVAYEMVKNNQGAAIRWYGTDNAVTTPFPDDTNQLDVVNLIKDNGPKSQTNDLTVTIIGSDTTGDSGTNIKHNKYYTSLEYANSKAQLYVSFGPLLGSVAKDDLTTEEIYGTPQPIAVPAGVYYPVGGSSSLEEADLLKQTHKSEPNQYSFYFNNIVLDKTANNDKTNTLDSTGTWRTELSKFYDAVVKDFPSDISFSTNPYSSVIADLEDGRLDPATTLTNLNTTKAPADAQGATPQALGFSVEWDDSYDATQNSGTFEQALWFMNILPKGKGEIVCGSAASELSLTSSASTDKIKLTIGTDEYALWNGEAPSNSAAARKKVGPLLDKTISAPTHGTIKKRNTRD